MAQNYKKSMSVPISMILRYLRAGKVSSQQLPAEFSVNYLFRL
jgi:hypothetical protein